MSVDCATVLSLSPRWEERDMIYLFKAEVSLHFCNGPTKQNVLVGRVSLINDTNHINNTLLGVFKMNGLLVVVGAGPGIGNHVAKKFGEQGFRVVLVSRDRNKLENYLKEFNEKNIEAFAVTADVASRESIAHAFKEIKDKYGQINVMVYNAALVADGKPSELTREELYQHFQIDVQGALDAALQVIPEMMGNEGTMLFTGGGLGLHPAADYAALSIGKAGIRALALSLAEELKPKGIFVGTVTITGFVAEGTMFAPALIADQYWELYKNRTDHEIIYSE